MRLDDFNVSSIKTAILAILKKIFRYIEWAEPNTYLGRPKLLSSIVNSDGLTLHVPNLIRGEEKY